MANQLQRSTNFAEMFEDRVQKEHQQYQQQEQTHGAEPEAGAEDVNEPTVKDENQFRKELKKELRSLMDE